MAWLIEERKRESAHLTEIVVRARFKYTFWNHMVAFLGKFFFFYFQPLLCLNAIILRILCVCLHIEVGLQLQH